MRKRLIIVCGLVILTSAIVATLLIGNHSLLHPPAAVAQGHANSSHGQVSLAAFHALFFVWASGTPEIQDVAAHDCTQLALSGAQCASVSDTTRAAWLELASRDPAALGRPDAAPNVTGRTEALDALSAQLGTITGGRVAALTALTQATYAQVNQPQWVLEHIAAGRSLPVGTELVWATSFSQSSLPNGLNPKRSNYVALPDAYLKYANWGQLGNIPTIYQPYYTPSGGAAHWAVTVATANGSRSASNVLVTDVGPWNEDDNWWDPNGATATLPASCPVSATLVAPDATSNVLVDGICPNGVNLRRIYYYLLYTHHGLPFFQPGGYAPSGSFTDGAAWPGALQQYCSEAVAASQNSDGVTCYTGTSGYNRNNGGWLRNGTYDAGITNQSSIDLSPAVNKALGWVYPSSGLVQVTVSSLP